MQGRGPTNCCARKMIGLVSGPRGLELLRRQGREEPVWEPEVIPKDRQEGQEEPQYDRASDNAEKDVQVEKATNGSAPAVPPRISIPNFNKTGFGGPSPALPNMQ